MLLFHVVFNPPNHSQLNLVAPTLEKDVNAFNEGSKTLQYSVKINKKKRLLV
jgi:hypothetical protein